MANKHERLSSAAPLVEAVLELRTTTRQPYTLIPGELISSLRKHFPTVQETELTKIIGLMSAPPGVGLLVGHRFQSADGKSMVQLGPNGISFHSLTYPGFDYFSERVSEVIASYMNVSDVETLGRVGLRYINNIKAPSIADGLSARISWPNIEGGIHRTTAARGVLEFSDPPGNLAIAIADPQAGVTGVTLDLDYYYEPNAHMPLNAILTWIDAAHDRLYAAFRSMIPNEIYSSWKA